MNWRRTKLTDEEMSEEWLDERYLKDMGVRKPCKEAFLAGLRAGKDMVETDIATIAYMQGAERYKMKWHDLRKNPDDLPKESGYYIVSRYSNYLRIKRHSQTLYFIKGKRNGWNTKMDKTQIIAWCEIPKFEEN